MFDFVVKFKPLASYTDGEIDWYKRRINDYHGPFIYQGCIMYDVGYMKQGLIFKYIDIGTVEDIYLMPDEESTK